MTRRHLVIICSVLVGMVAGVGGTLWSLYQAPSFYAAALQEHAPSPARKERSKKFVQNTMELVDSIRHEQNWSEEFDQDQVNSWLAEELHQKYSKWLPEGVKEPRVQFGPDSLELAFQYQKGVWSGVISAQLRPWVSSPNRLAIEVQSVKAGLVPIPLDDLVLAVSRELARAGWQVECTRNDDNDVLIVQFGSGDTDQSILETVNLEARVLRISGSRKSPRALADLPERYIPYGTSGVARVLSASQKE